MNRAFGILLIVIGSIFGLATIASGLKSIQAKSQEASGAYFAGYIAGYIFMIGVMVVLPIYYGNKLIKKANIEREDIAKED